MDIGKRLYRGESAVEPVGILFLDHTAQLGGGEIALLRLVSNLDRSRFRPVVVLFSNGPLVDRLRDADVDVHVLLLDERITQTRKDSLGLSALLRVADIGRMLAFVCRLAKLTRSLDVKIVHANSLKSDVVGAIAGRLARKQIIWHVRDRIANDYLPPIVARTFRLLCRVLPHYIIANSASTLATIGKQVDGSAIPSGIKVDQNARIVHDGIAPSSHPFNEPSRGSRGYRVGLVGRLAPWKGQHIFIEAASLARERFPTAKFLIVGSSMFGEAAYEKELLKKVANLGLDKTVEFLGFREDVSSIIDGLDVLVHASTTPEPFGQVVIEGMAAGKPVVATRGGGVMEIVSDRVNGRLVSMGNALEMSDSICEVLADPDAARTLGLNGRAHIAMNFSIEATVRKVQNVYDHLLERGRSEMPLAPGAVHEIP